MLGALEAQLTLAGKKRSLEALIEAAEWRESDEGAEDRCWGSLLGAEHCTPGFRIGKSHFKNKARPRPALRARRTRTPSNLTHHALLASQFCSECRAHGIQVSTSRVRAIPEELYTVFINGHGEGFYTPLTGHNETARAHFRLVNQTLKCRGPRLVLFRDEPPALTWAQLPDEWLDGFGSTPDAPSLGARPTMRLRVSKGTLIPAAESATINTITSPFVRPVAPHAIAPYQPGPYQPPAPIGKPLHPASAWPDLGLGAPPGSIHPVPLAHPPAARAPALVAAPPTAARVPPMSIGGVGPPPGSRASLLPPGPGIGLPGIGLPGLPPYGGPPAGAVALPPALNELPPELPGARPLATAYAATAFPGAPPAVASTSAAAPALDAVRNAFALGGPGFYGGPFAAADPANGPFGAGPANPANGPFGAGTGGPFVPGLGPFPSAPPPGLPGGGGLPGGPGGLAPFAAPPTIPSMPPSFSSGAQPHLPQVLVSHSDAEVRAEVRLPLSHGPAGHLAPEPAAAAAAVAEAIGAALARPPQQQKAAALPAGLEDVISAGLPVGAAIPAALPTIVPLPMERARSI